MAHELEHHTGGKAAMFSVRETPWHRLGTILESAPSSSEALVLAGADFAVGLHPVFADVSADAAQQGPVLRRVDGRLATVRLDTLAPLGIVTRRYAPLQNHAAFHILDPLIDDGRVTLETGGVIRGGADVWIMARLRLPATSEAADFSQAHGIEPFFLLANNHSARRGVLCSLTPIRVVCANTLGLAERYARENAASTASVRHSGSVERKVRDAARRLLESVVAQMETFSQQQLQLQQCRLEMNEWNTMVLDCLAKLPRVDASPGTRRLLERNAELARRKRERLTWLWDNGPGHRGERSAWEAYQAVTHSIDHDEHLWGSRLAPQARLGSLLDGRLGWQKRSILERLLLHSFERN